jgi:hypothetical protein
MKPSITGFENQTGKLSYTLRKVWLTDVDAWESPSLVLDNWWNLAYNLCHKCDMS